MHNLSFVILMPAHVNPHDFVVSEHAEADGALGVLALQLGNLLRGDVVMRLHKVLIERFELRKCAPAFKARGRSLSFSGLVALHVRPVHVLRHKVPATSGHLAGVSRLHFNLDGLEAGLAVGVVHVIAVSAQVQELSHADGTLIADHFGQVVSEVGSHVRAVNAVVNGALQQKVNNDVSILGNSMTSVFNTRTISFVYECTSFYVLKYFF